MSSVDNRIVQMQFENSQFEKGVQQSLKSIDELKKNLEFKDAEKSMQALQRAGDSFSLVKMGNAIDSISEKFSILGIIGKRVLENLADTAYDKITSTVKALSVDQISAGWSKYADKTKAVQQIMAATHLDIESVNHELERLNWFSDETSYSFTDMVSNIGKFTSMNVPLDKSVTAMQGISTWAALSGAGVQEASRAMYNLSQAMGLGSLKMQDWKSIALANMATSEFKQTAIDTAVALGKLRKGQVTLENFESTLKSGWFDKDVMMSVFEQYGDFATQAYELATKEGISAAEAMDRLSDGTKSLGERAFRAAQEAITFGQAIEATKDAVSSGWMNVFEQIFGNYEQAKVLWTDLANYMWDIFASPLSEIGGIFKLWNEGVDEEGEKILGTRADALEGIYDIFDGIYGIILAIKDAFSQIFPPLSLENLQSASLAIKEFGANFKKTFEYIEGTRDKIRTLTDTEFAEKQAKQAKEWLEAVKAAFEGNLKIKDTGDRVKELQQQLKELGYDGVGAIDGIFGSKTQAALKKFQQDAGLSASGILDEKTYIEIATRIKNLQNTFSKPLVKGDRGAEVEKLQKKLIELGYLDDKADGIFGPKTKAALEKWQKASKKLKDDGTFDEDDFKEMFPEDQLSNIEKTVEEWTWFGTTLTNIQGIVKGVSAVFDIFFQVLGFVGKIIGHIVTLAMPLVNAILSVGAAVGEAIASFDEWLKMPGNLDGAFESIKAFFEPIGDWAKTAGENIKKFFGLAEAPEGMITFPKLWENIKESISKTGAFKRVSKAIDEFKKKLAKIKPELKKSWKAFKESLGEKFNAFLSGIPDKIAAVTDAIGTFITDGINLVTSWLPTIPGAIDKVKAFFNALTDPGDAATGKAPGFLYKVKQGFEDVIDFLFGKGDITKGKAPGILTKLWKILIGDYEGAGLSEDQQKELIGKIEEVKATFKKIGDAISLLLTGEISNDTSLSEKAQVSIEQFRIGLFRIFEALNLLFGGTPLGEEETNLSPDTVKNIENFKNNVINVAKTIGDFFGSISDTLGGFFSGEFDFTSLEGIRKTFDDIWNNIIIFFNGVGDNAGNAAQVAGSIAIGVIALPFIGISKIISTVSSYIQSIITQDYSGFTEEVAAKLENVRNWFDYTFKVIRALFTGNYRGLDGKTTSKILEFRAKVKPIFEAIRGFFSITWGFIQDIWIGITTGNWETENGQKIKDAFETVKRFFDKVGEGISILFTGEGNGDLLDSNTVSTLKQFNGYLTTIKGGVVNFFNGAWGFAQDIWTGITTGDWDGFKDRIANAFNNVKNFFVNIGYIIRAFFTGKYDGLDTDKVVAVARARIWVRNKLKVVGEFLAKIPSLVKEWVDETLKNAGPVGQKVASVFSGISSFFTGVWGTISDVWTGITTGNWTGLKDKIANAFNNVKNFFVNIGYIIRAFFTGNYRGLDGKATSKILEFRANVKNFFAKIGKIIAAFFTDDIAGLDLDDDTKKWVLGAKAKIKEILGNITEFFKNLPETFKGWGEDLQKNFGPLGNFFSTIFNAIGSVINFIIKHPILSLLIYGLFSLIRFIGSATGLIFKVSDALSNLRGSNQTFSQMIRSVAISFAIVAASIYVLGSVMDEEQLKQGMDAFLSIIKTIGIFVLAAAVLSTTKLIPGPLKGITEKLSSLTKMIKDIGIGVALLTLSIWLLSKMMATEESIGNFLKGLVALFAILLELFIFFAGLALINKYIGKIETVLDGLWQVAVLIGAMALALAALTVMNSITKPETVWVSIAQLASMFAMIAGLFLVVGYANKLAGISNIGDNKPLLKGLGALAVLIGVMGLIVGAFVAMNSLGLNVWQAILQLFAIFAMIGALFWAISKTGNIKVSWGVLIAAFVGLGAMIWVLGDALSKMGDVEWPVVVAFTVGSAILLAALAFVLPALSKLNPKGAIKACLALVVFAVAFGLAVSLLTSFGEQATGGFTRALQSIGAAIAIFNDLSSRGGDKSVDLLVFVETIINAMTRMANASSLYGYAEQFATILMRIGASMAIYSGLTSGLTTDNGAALGSLASGLSDALSNLSNIENADQIVSLLQDVGAALGLFYGELSKIDTGAGTEIDTSAVQSAFDALGSLTIDDSAIANIGRYANDGGGVKEFALGVESLSTAIGNYGTQIGGLDEGAVTQANSVLNTIGGIAVNLGSDSSGLFGLIGSLTGQRSVLEQFSMDVAELGSALGSYGTSIGTLDKSSISNANTVLTSIAGLDIDAEGGFFSFLQSSKSKGLQNFANNITQIGSGLAKFNESISGQEFDATKITAAITPLDSLADIQGKMAEIGGIGSWISGEQSLGALGNQLKDFGSDLAEFSDSVKDMEFGEGTNLDSALSVLDAVAAVHEKLGQAGLTDFYALEQIGTSMERFFMSMARIDTSQGEFASEGLTFDQALDAADWIGMFDTTNIIDGINKFVTDITTAATQAQTDVHTAIQALLSFDPAELSVAMNEGMASGADDSGARQAALTMLSGAESYISQFNTVGMNYALGLAQGMLDHASACGAAGTVIGQAAIDAAREVGVVSSPSQVLFAIGEYFGLGFVKGLESYAPIIDNACYAIFGGALSGIQNLFKENASNNLVDMLFGGFKSKDAKDAENSIGGLWNGIKGIFTGSASSNSGLGLLGGLIASKASSNSGLGLLGTVVGGLLTTNASSNSGLGILGGLLTSNASSTSGLGMLSELLTDPSNALGQFAEKIGLTGAAANTFGIDLSNPEEVLKSLATQMGLSEEQMSGLTEGFFGLEAAATNVSTSLPQITKQLQKGDWDDDQVKAMQERLMALGFDLSKFGADGKFGDETLAALKAFEEKYKLTVDGILDETEAAKLEAETANLASSAGESVMAAFGNSGNVDTSSAEQAATDMVAAFKSHGNEFYGAGGYFTLGLAGGASKYLSTAVNAAAAVAAAMLAKVREVFNSASPSKETAKYGMWFDQGLAKGVNDYSNEATTSSEDVANAMLKTTKGTLSNLSNILAKDIDDTPTISPVVDLTNARAAAASIGGMFGTQTFGVESANLAGKANESYFANKAASQKARDSLTSVTGRSNTSNTSSNVNLTGNVFNVRSDRDIDNLAYEIASISKQQLKGIGQRV